MNESSQAFSKVVQKLIGQRGTLERLLDIFNASSNVEKTFLFDISSKVSWRGREGRYDKRTRAEC